MVDHSSSSWLSGEEASGTRNKFVLLAGKHLAVDRVTAATLAAAMLCAIAAESVTALVDPVLGTALHGILFLVLLNVYAFARALPRRQAFLILSLVPLLRILSLAMPIARLHRLYWFPLVGIPLLFAALMAARATGMSLGLSRSNARRGAATANWDRQAWLVQALIGVCGIPLSIIAYYLLQPRPLIYRTDLSWGRLLLAALTLIVFTGFLEEIIFRGLLQRASGGVFGAILGLVLTSLVYGSMYLGSVAPNYILLMVLVSLVFGVCVHSTGSVWGVAVARGLLNVGAFLVWPLLFR